MRYLPLVGVMLLIFLLSHTPGQDLPEGIGGLDKLCHALAYATLAAAALWAWLPLVKKHTIPTLGAILIFCLLYGISDEFHQSFIPGRSPSLDDIVADFTGSVLCLGVWLIWFKKKGNTT